ncbi:AMP-dependent synthetase/ligase [Sulfuriflexus sp.]|uniref:AMP-dependent synthetase/ligase n=1 Tax=Sulfuriflexus sp. TaxID=2015443 RepID=UPI0028CCE4E7|nr:AMP-dependent synthetase/ligase [Sulfuriflexus sp.]MDT8403968.1 AMP-dependent synthetase/ligase [Sulfuriflexus sp.]
MTTTGTDLIKADEAGTLDGLFLARLHHSPDAIAYRQFDKSRAQWRELSWRELAEQVSCWQQALRNEGLQSGDRVALLMRNSSEWVIADQAAFGLGLVIVPLYCDDRADNIAYIIGDAGVRLLIADACIWHRIAAAGAGLDSLQRVITVFSNTDKDDDNRVLAAEQWLEKTAPEPLQKREANGHELATIVYTSGTTGRPKGVMLSHRNILSVTESALATYTLYPEDVFLSFLPLSHTFERTAGYYLPMMAGASVAFARSITQLADDLLQIRPTAMIAVPRIFERLYKRILQQVKHRPLPARLLFRLTIRTGWWRFESRQGRGGLLTGLLARLINPSLDKLIARKIRARLGGRLRLCVSGGAALPYRVAQSMIGLGLNIAQGYGLTETSPVISGNPLDDNDPASVGVALRDVNIKIDANHELLVKTHGMMLGYWHNPEATAAIIDADGWLHTGDLARIENNHIYIIGRMKDILVLSNGEKVPPADMEASICLDSLCEQAMVLGEGEAFLSAVIVLNKEEWTKVAPQLGIEDPFGEKTLTAKKVRQHVLDRLRKQLKGFPVYAKVRRLILTFEPWTVDNGLLTPTLKIKRNKIQERYAREINSIYTS